MVFLNDFFDVLRTLEKDSPQGKVVHTTKSPLELTELFVSYGKRAG